MSETVYHLGLPKGQVLGFYPDTGEWKSVAYIDYPSIRELAEIAGHNPSCTMLRYRKYRYDCGMLKAAMEEELS